jgi:hypothetical protein
LSLKFLRGTRVGTVIAFLRINKGVKSFFPFFSHNKRFPVLVLIKNCPFFFSEYLAFRFPALVNAASKGIFSHVFPVIVVDVPAFPTWSFE